jgi:RimJ/RimL family protein N-acetyltransferase
MSFSPPRSVETPRFRLRSWTVADAPLLQAALDASEAHLRAWTPWVVDGRVPGLSLEGRLASHAEAFTSGKEWVYGIFSPEEAEVLGGCGLYPRVGPGALEIGYWIHVAHTGRGLATESAAVLTRTAFADPGIERVEIRCEAGNVGSIAVPRKLGYRHAATLQEEHGELLVWEIGRAEAARLVSML